MITLSNDQFSLTIDLLGGAFVDYRMHHSAVNPLNFKLLHPSKGQEDIYFKGHFLCLGRWGDPSSGELAAGLNKHGEFSKMPWVAEKNEAGLHMTAHSALEGLHVDRLIQLSKDSACFRVVERIKNTNALGRMYNMVQHPTIAAPFLDESTFIDCNATLGFDYAFEHYAASIMSLWPQVLTKNGQTINLDKPDKPYSSVCSFVVNPNEEYGWITACSPKHNLLLGYVWERSHYPWINHWLHWDNDSHGFDKLTYRGLEFGTTGVHKPFEVLLNTGLTNLLNEPTYSFIDAGDEHQRSYYSFICTVPAEFKGVETINIQADTITLIEKETLRKNNISHSFNLYHEL